MPGTSGSSRRLSTAAARWNLIGTPVMISPLNLLDLAGMVKPPLMGVTGAVVTGTLGNVDQWYSQAADRVRLLNQLAGQHPPGRTVLLTGAFTPGGRPPRSTAEWASARNWWAALCRPPISMTR